MSQHVNAQGITFGTTIKALRYGFGVGHCAFIRISGEGPWKIECVPFGERDFPKSINEHRCWWPESQDKPGVNTRDIIPIRHVLRLKRAVTFWINDAGEAL